MKIVEYSHQKGEKMALSINIPAILIANAMGLAILFVVAVGNLWRLNYVSKENMCLRIMVLCGIMNCIADPACFLADGHSGLLNRILVIGCNSLLYLGGLIIAFVWVYLISIRLQVKLRNIHNKILHTIFMVMVLVLIANLFVPILFYVDENNVYSRLAGYWVYNVCYFAFMLDGLVLYLRQRYMSGGLKFFPVWAFIFPAAFGMSAQAMFYGISTATPFTTVSVVCVIICLQNEFMLRDKLTGLYNRFYLDDVENKLKKFHNLNYSAIMLDVNGFKKINDEFGHNVGDKALIEVASILTDAVGRVGEVIRYAGDEFIIIINRQNENEVEKAVARINDFIDKFNNEGNRLYKFSVAIGYCKLDLKNDTMDGCMDKMDKLMYVNKQEYYRSHTR